MRLSEKYRDVIDFMDEVLYELWLHSICGFEPKTAAAAATVFENAENAFKSKVIDEKCAEKLGLPKKIVGEFEKSEYFRNAMGITKYCKENDIRIITMNSEEYPEILKSADTPPRILFAKGKALDMNNCLGIAVVGCRKPSPQGRLAAERVAANLAEHGIVTIGGMAEGIDAAAHRAALKAGGRTVAVLAGGVDTIYPMSNEKLYYDIIENGTIISERPPGAVGKKYYYQQRNRIIVGMSHGVVIAEGKKKGGSAIYARLAAENNRDVFAIPGNPTMSQSELPNLLIADGATVVNNENVPIDFYKEVYPELVQKRTTAAQTDSGSGAGLTDDEKKLVEIIKNLGGAARMENIAEESGMPVGRVGSHLMMLVIKGVLATESGNRYVLLAK